MRDQFIATLSELAADDPRIMLLTGDLGFSVLDSFRARFPRQLINVGVAEQNMTLVATGLALEGHVVFTYSIGNFPTLRCLEMIRNDAAYHAANVKVVSVGGGFSYGALGISHHATEDLAILRSLPDVTCFAPTGNFEVIGATRAAAHLPGTCYLRLDKDCGPDGPTAEPFCAGSPRFLRKGQAVALITTGGILSEVCKAAEDLDRQGIDSSVLSVHTLNPVNPDLFLWAARNHKAIVTVEEHTIRGGLGSLVAEILVDHGCTPSRFLRIGLEGCFSSIVGSQAALRAEYRMDAKTIVSRTRDLLKTLPA